MEISGYLGPEVKKGGLLVTMEKCMLDISRIHLNVQACVREVESTLGRYCRGASGLAQYVVNAPVFVVRLGDGHSPELLERLRLVYATGKRPWPFVGVWASNGHAVIVLLGEGAESGASTLTAIRRMMHLFGRNERASFFTSRSIDPKLHETLGIVKDEIQGNREGGLPAFWYQLIPV